MWALMYCLLACGGQTTGRYVCAATENIETKRAENKYAKSKTENVIIQLAKTHVCCSF